MTDLLRMHAHTLASSMDLGSSGDVRKGEEGGGWTSEHLEAFVAKGQSVLAHLDHIKEI